MPTLKIEMGARLIIAIGKRQTVREKFAVVAPFGQGNDRFHILFVRFL